jgi:hypothetical protein
MGGSRRPIREELITLTLDRELAEKFLTLLTHSLKGVLKDK